MSYCSEHQIEYLSEDDACPLCERDTPMLELL